MDVKNVCKDYRDFFGYMSNTSPLLTYSLYFCLCIQRRRETASDGKTST